MEQQATSLLKQYGLRVTTIRHKVVELFLASGSTALSNADIEQHFERLDRTTLYRTLRTLEQKGIIHQVVDNSGTTKYATSREHRSKQEMYANHVHFHCVKCEKTICLEKTPLPPVNPPSGFNVDEKHLLLTGTCSICAE